MKQLKLSVWLLFLFVCCQAEVKRDLLLQKEEEQISSKKDPIDNKWNVVADSDFTVARKSGTARWEKKKDGFWVYSWTFGDPGIVWLGNLGANQSIESKAVAERYAAHGYFGVVVGLVESDKEKGQHKNEVFMARVRGGTVELVQKVPLVWETVGVAKGVSIKPGEEAVVSLCVTKAKHLTVYLNGKEVISFESQFPIQGQVGIVAANGIFMFKQIRTGHGSSIGK